MTQDQRRGRGEKVISLGCLIFVSPLASHVRVLHFCESPRLSRWGAWFLWVLLPLTLGCFIFVSPLASHASRCLIFVSPLASHVSGCLIFVSPWPLTLGCFIFVSLLVTLTVDFQGQGYLSDFFQYFFRTQSIKLCRKTLRNPRFY